MKIIKSLAEVDTSKPPIYTVPLLNEPAPPFKAESTKGPINFPQDYRGKWVLFFSYPSDFCATCTTELIELAKNKELYDELGVKLVGLSIDSIYSHVAWLESINRLDYNGTKDIVIDFPLISDADRDISKKYGLIRRGQKDTETVRGGFLIDPKGKVRAITVYPREVGRGGEEVRRVVEALIKADKENILTPANWKPGDDVLLYKATNLESALKNLQKDDENANIFCPDWYLCYKKDPADVPNSNSSPNNQNTSLHNQFKNLNTPPYLKR